MNYPKLSSAALMVQEFHAFFNGIIRREPTRIAGRELALRKTLITEEYKELLEALDGDNLREQYKELADLVYVIYGLDAHLGGRLDEVIDAVHTSNMTKLWDCDLKGCVDGRYMPPEGYKKTDVTNCPQCLGTGQCAKFREDGKVLKPPTYQPADLSFLPEHPETKDEL